ncbi:hypothetical protein GC177_03080 [bacterium]|nr:hypothetical protein [bacterium]
MDALSIAQAARAAHASTNKKRIKLYEHPSPVMQRPVVFTGMKACSKWIIQQILQDYFEENYRTQDHLDKDCAEVVLYRHPLISAAHRYWHKYEKNKSFKKADSPEQWEEFWQNHLSEFKHLFKTRLKPGKKSTIFLLETDAYIQAPFKTLCSLIAFISPAHKPDIYKIAQLLGKHPYPKDKSILSFSHYNLQCFTQMEKTVLEELKWLDIKPFFIH